MKYTQGYVALWFVVDLSKFLVDQRWLFTHAFKGCFIHWAHRKFALVAGHVILKYMDKICR